MHAITKDQRMLLAQYIDTANRIENWQSTLRQDQEKLDIVATELVNSFRGKDMPDVIVMYGHVIEISRGILHTEHTHPNHAVRMAKALFVE